MRVRIRIPATLRKRVKGRAEIAAEGSTVGEALRHLDGAYPGMWESLIGPSGEPHRYINIFADMEDIRFLDGLDTPLREGGAVVLVAAVAGG